MRTGAIVCLGAAAAALAACAGAPRPELAGLASSLAPAPDGPPPADDLVRIASDIEAHGEPPTALLLYERAAAARQDAPTRIALGDAYLRAGRVDDAAKAYRSVLALDPDNDDAVLGLGTALVQQHHLSDGLRLLQRVAPRLHTALAYDRLGVAQTLDGRFNDAIETLSIAQRLAPDDPDIATNLALATALGGAGGRALELMKHVTQSPDAELRHWRNLVLVAGLAGRPDAARAAIPLLARGEADALMRRAAAIRALGTPQLRAQALSSIGQTVAETPATGSGRYLAQIASLRSEADAKASFDTLQARFAVQLAGRQPIISRADLGDRGVFFRTQIGPFASRAEGDAFCGELRSTGAECVVKHE